ncbi:hypothetical protein FKO01_49320 [Mesorhizobium sp. B2-3-3]|nr:hypothetical protein FKO01_49320 [Mesorhizobium sp. B2-3-3]
MRKRGSKDYWGSLVCVSNICLLLATSGSSAQTLGHDDKITASDFLSELDPSMNMLTWPSYTRIYEILGGDPDIISSVDSYKYEYKAMFNMEKAAGAAQISIISVSPGMNEKDMIALLQSSKLLQGYKSFAYRARLGSDGCTAYKFTSRETWISVGLLFVDKTKFKAGDKAQTDSCIHRALDYISGFPSRNKYFKYMSLPGDLIRKAILGAIYRCAADGDNASRREETTRDSITPLPSLRCVKTKIGG